MFPLPLVSGHYGESFPHLCPGSDCAIAAWLKRKIAAVVHHGLK